MNPISPTIPSTSTRPWRWQAWHRLFAWTTRVITRLLSAGKLFENIAMLSFLLIVTASVACVVGLLMRHIDPAPQITIGSFTSLSGDLKTGEATSTTVTNLLSDSLDDVIEEGATFRGNAYASTHQFTAPAELPKLPVSRAFDFSWKGVSFGQIVAVWDSIRHQQLRISGEILPSEAKASGLPQWVIHTRLTGDATKTWTSLPFVMTQESLRTAVQDLAQQMLTSENPELSGRYSLSRKDYRKAVFVFSQWLATDPNNPAPNAWIARSFALETAPEDMAPAKIFAERALQDIPKSSRWSWRKQQHQNQISDTATMVLGTVASRSGNREEAKRQFASEKDNPAALLDLAEVESDMFHDHTNARLALQAAIGQERGYKGAWLNLAKVSYAEKKYAEAEKEVNAALGIDPFFADAVDFYLMNELTQKDIPRTKLFCQEWLAPVLLNKMPPTANPRAYGYCAIAEADSPAPDIPTVVAYQQRTWQGTSALDPIALPSLNLIVNRLCPLPTSKASRPKSVANMRSLVDWLRTEKQNAAVARCSLYASAATRQ
jgi:tetratricopeptide (TPR) repeat protein